ncbi:MAG: MG2 domain-containing protein [Chloroflexota bacterium]
MNERFTKKKSVAKQWVWQVCLLSLIIFIIAIGCTPPYRNPLRLSVIGHPFTLNTGNEAQFQVLLWDKKENIAISGAQIATSLALPNGPSEIVVRSTTNTEGVATVQLNLPEGVPDGHYQLTVQARHEENFIEHNQTIQVGPHYNILVSTDKPIYQPGQVIHIRTLALASNDMTPADNKPLMLTVEDPKGNTILQKEFTTSQWGIVSTDFALDTKAMSGNYTVVSQLGDDVSQRSVEVKPYQLPRFKVDFKTDQAFYMPGDTATLTVDSQYFFGKPVAQGQVNVTLQTDVSGQIIDLEPIKAQTNEAGLTEISLLIPSHLEPLIAQSNESTIKLDLEIMVIDSANHAETISEKITVANQPLIIEAIPESGTLHPDVENIIYLHTTYPNGQPAEVTLTIYGENQASQTIKSDAFGLASTMITPQRHTPVQINIEAIDHHQHIVNQTIHLNDFNAAYPILLRPDRTRYQLSDTVSVETFVAASIKTVYLEIVKGGQTFTTEALSVQNGVATANIQLDNSLLGTVELHAYGVDQSGHVNHDERLILVEPTATEVELTTDIDVYRPGDTARLNVSVQKDGSPIVGALGVSIVDESVFALGAQKPGFARTFFLLERELLKPHYQIRDYTSFGNEPPSGEIDYNPVQTLAHQTDIERELLLAARETALTGVFAQALHEDAVIRQAGFVLVPQESNNAGTVGLLAIPLMGLVLASGWQRRHRIFMAIFIIGATSSFMIVGCSPTPPAGVPAEAASDAMADDDMAMAEESAVSLLQSETERATATEQTASTRLRQFFPETMLWLPELETDENGQAQLDIPIADSITTWRVSVLASDDQGNLGSGQLGLRVFQEFFIEPDLPRFLNQHDSIAIPIRIFNYLDEPQEIVLNVEPADWFAFIKESETALTVEAGEVTVVYVPIRVTKPGIGDFQVTATSDQMSDAVLRQVEVKAEGHTQRDVLSQGRLSESIQQQITIPADTVAGTQSLTVKIFPGVTSQIVGGLDGMLRQPNGCFEQTSSTTYPNVLILDYLQKTGQTKPEITERAEKFINLGYQRLLTFEVDGSPGGFSLFGGPPPWPMLTAYGLMEFADMSKVSYVDPDLLDRTAAFLFSHQTAEGSWQAEGMTVESGWERMGNADLPVTAYVTWVLIEAGYRNYIEIDMALEYIRNNIDLQEDPYVLALILNALASDHNSQSIVSDLLDHLMQQSTVDQSGRSWSSNIPTYMGGYDQVASIETTAMIAMAMLKTRTYRDETQEALDFLMSQRDSYGSFHTTQSTILALKALILAAEQASSGEGTITVTLNNETTQTITLDETNGDAVQAVRFDNLTAGETYTLDLTTGGEGVFQYQIVTDYNVTWQSLANHVEPDTAAPRVLLDVIYDRTELAVNELVQVTAHIELQSDDNAGTLLVDLGLPPGFSPRTEDLDQMIDAGLVDRYELTGQQIILYLTDVPAWQTYDLTYRLQARFPIYALTGKSHIYDYYTPGWEDIQAPRYITVLPRETS